MWGKGPGMKCMPYPLHFHAAHGGGTLCCVGALPTAAPSWPGHMHTIHAVQCILSSLPCRRIQDVVQLAKRRDGAHPHPRGESPAAEYAPSCSAAGQEAGQRHARRLPATRQCACSGAHAAPAAGLSTLPCSSIALLVSSTACAHTHTRAHTVSCLALLPALPCTHTDRAHAGAGPRLRHGAGRDTGRGHHAR